MTSKLGRKSSGSRLNDPPWFRVRGYRHFDKPIKKRSAIALVTNPLAVCRHAFLPFIHFEMKERRRKKAIGKYVWKVRPIAYASHVDSHVFAFYSKTLADAYEEWLSANGLSDVALAYRAFAEPKCNIHFSHEAFQPIQDGTYDCAIGMDVEGFFDNLDHSLLKEKLCCLLGTHKLPDDHYKVFRAITRFSKVDLYKCLSALGIGARRLREGRHPLCNPQEFRDKIRGGGLIETNKAGKGIPQGSPISAVLSNIYMMEFDKQASGICTATGASYRRYSDDILILCKAGDALALERQLSDLLEQQKLTAQSSKTTRSSFTRTASGKLQVDHPFQYLGLVFDGERIMMRSQTLARHHRKVRRAVYFAGKKAMLRAKKSGNPVRLFRRKLYEKFTHLGGKNFLTYATRVARITSDQTAKRQVRGNWRALHRLIDEIERGPQK